MKGAQRINQNVLSYIIQVVEWALEFRCSQSFILYITQVSPNTHTPPPTSRTICYKK